MKKYKVRLYYHSFADVEVVAENEHDALVLAAEDACVESQIDENLIEEDHDIEEFDIPSAKEFMDRVLEDDETDEGGVSFVGETLADFLEETMLSPDLNMHEVNENLIECGIKPIEF